MRSCSATLRDEAAQALRQLPEALDVRRAPEALELDALPLALRLGGRDLARAQASADEQPGGEIEQAR